MAGARGVNLGAHGCSGAPIRNGAVRENTRTEAAESALSAPVLSHRTLNSVIESRKAQQRQGRASVLGVQVELLLVLLKMQVL